MSKKTPSKKTKKAEKPNSKKVKRPTFEEAMEMTFQNFGPGLKRLAKYDTSHD